MKVLLLMALLFFLASCQKNNKALTSSNKWSASTKIEELGYHLFFESKFSADDSISCNTCHNILERGNGAQNTAVSTGIKGAKGGRNSPTVWNAKFLSVQFWDGRAKDLVEQAKGPITNPIEMGMESHDLAISKIQTLDKYQNLFKEAFPSVEKPINIDNAAKAIAAFEETLTTINSPYDKDSMTIFAQKGYEVFKNVGCASCHSGAHFAGPEMPTGTGFFMKFPTYPNKNYEQKYNFSKDKGRYEATKNNSDLNMWRVPTLRNVAITAPYFHNGSVSELETAIAIMGKTQLNKNLNPEQVQSIKAFLESLTGDRPLIENPKNI